MKTTTSVREATLHAFKGPEYLVVSDNVEYRFSQRWESRQGHQNHWYGSCPPWMPCLSTEFTLLDPPAPEMPKMTDEEWVRTVSPLGTLQVLKRVREIVKEELER